VLKHPESSELVKENSHWPKTYNQKQKIGPEKWGQQESYNCW